jgi:hypothetical protein
MDQKKGEDEISVDILPTKHGYEGGISDFINEDVETEWSVREEKILLDLRIKCDGYHYLFTRSRKHYLTTYSNIMIPFAILYALQTLMQSFNTIFQGLQLNQHMVLGISCITTFLLWASGGLIGLNAKIDPNGSAKLCKEFARAFASLSNDIETTLKLPRSVRIAPNRMIVDVIKTYNRLRKEDEIITIAAINEYKTKFKKIKQKVEVVSETYESDNKHEEYPTNILHPFLKAVAEIKMSSRRFTSVDQFNEHDDIEKV